jgi:hypothetical protein
MAAAPPLRTFASKVLITRRHHMKRIIRATRLVVAAPIVAVALLAACGDDPDEATGAAAPQRVDAPARLEARAEQYARSAHLQGQAKTHGAPAHDAAGTNPSDARNWPLAESLERSAHLEGQASTHSKTGSSDDVPAAADEPPDGEFVPGSRHMPTR